MFKNILIPLDGSTLSEQAVHQLPHVADKEAIIHLLQIVRIPKPSIEPEALPTMPPTEAEEQLLNEARTYLNGKVNELRLAGFDVRGSVLPGDDPAYQIVSYASNKGIDLIVMSTHSRGGIKKLVFGSVTNDVVRHAPCPVLVVRTS
jgi:nucleotide-binding universal stress UspA family protein